MLIKDLPGPFNVTIPEVYQIELSSACNFDCKMCPRTMFERKDSRSFFALSLLERMLWEGDFKGSYFLEFQMAGEPLLHPEFEITVEMVNAALPDLFLGLSTNGYYIKEKIKGLQLLDYITVSVDSLNEEEYSDIRRNGDVERLKENIYFLLNNLDLAKTIVDLQLVELPGYTQRLAGVVREFGGKINGRIRTVPDCFLTLYHPVDIYPVKRTPCLNPWLSVSVQANGNVVPCCFCFGDDIILGNLNEASLEEIWNCKTVKVLREQHTNGNYVPICTKCYMRSPTLLHWELFTNFIKGKKK